MIKKFRVVKDENNQKKPYYAEYSEMLIKLDEEHYDDDIYEDDIYRSENYTSPWLAISDLCQQLHDDWMAENIVSDEKARIRERFELAGMPVPEVYR